MSENNKFFEDNRLKYEYFDVTADIGFYSFGNTLEEAFENAALAMFNVITDVKKVKAVESREISIESEDEVSLLYDWLEELLFIHEVDFLLLSDFKIISIVNEDNSLKLESIVKGDNIDWAFHERKSEVKAITFHQMEVNEIEGKYQVKAILDL
ncbi:MAG: archease [Methanobrevibacter sp.]|jgi:SHS2 domain-containing protein|nr:archease [Methanobrevibacter sp.]